MDIEVFKDEWQDWKSSKVTKAFLKSIFIKREFLKEGLAENNHTTEQERLIDVGQCIAIKDNIDYAIEGFQYLEREAEEKHDAESSGI